MIRVPIELLRRYDRPGPRYTSYPTAVAFHDGVGPEIYAEHLAEAARRESDPLSLYLHLPFCRERCWYCGCNVVITSKTDVERRYRQALLAEVREVGRRLGGRTRLKQLHWGGGTPTFGDPQELLAFHNEVLDVFQLEDDAEVAVEVDPRVTTTAHLEALAEGGFNRLSLGVQDFTPEVQEAVNRIQSFEQTRELIETARALGFGSVNIDLIYGLPKQSPETFQQTLAQVEQIRPERIAIYSYAHVPWIQKKQNRIQVEDLPTPETKLELFESAAERLIDFGYVEVGMDHFALPDDELGLAAEAGTLGRNFMGYTVKQAPDTIACGVSAIGDVAGGFFQNEKHLARYERAVNAGDLATVKGCLRTDEDRLRGHIITELMVNMRLDMADVERRFEIDFDRKFAKELDALSGPMADGLVVRSDGILEVTPLGRRLVRNVCMAFDGRLATGDDKPVYSRTV